MLNKAMADDIFDPLYEKWLLEAAQRARLELSAKQLEQLLVFCSFLLEKNKLMNLTSITGPEELAVKHFLDSWMLLPLLDQKKQVKSFANVGSGAGFPGIALKIVRPEIEMVLIDAREKRVSFLAEAIEKLELKGIKALHLRAEEAGRDPDFRDKFSVVAARAVAALPRLVELCLPLVARSGRFYAMKAEAQAEIDQSLAAISQLAGSLRKAHQFFLPGTEMKRTIIEIEKMDFTPQKYPRSFAQIKSKPLH